MGAMRVLIVDDEPAARRRLVSLLAEMTEMTGLGVEVVGEAGSGVEALELVAALRPDLVLLDIAMPEVDGFDVARHLAEPRPLVVFQTAYAERALEAFEHEALDYVVKPVTRERLARAVERARRRLAEGPRAEIGAALLRRLAASLGTPPARRRLLVRSGRGHRLLPLAEVARFTTQDGLVYAHTAAGRHLTDYTLAEVEERTAGLFVRASRGELVNVDRIARLVSNGDGSATLTLADGEIVRVSRRRAADVKRALEA